MLGKMNKITDILILLVWNDFQRGEKGYGKNVEALETQPFVPVPRSGSAFHNILLCKTL